MKAKWKLEHEVELKKIQNKRYHTKIKDNKRYNRRDHFKDDPIIEAMLEVRSH